jgi:hypothetical protein
MGFDMETLEGEGTPGLRFETQGPDRIAICNLGACCVGKETAKPPECPGTPDALSVSIAMKDLLFVIVTSAFFALAWLYARSCEKI